MKIKEEIEELVVYSKDHTVNYLTSWVKPEWSRYPNMQIYHCVRDRYLMRYEIHGFDICTSFEDQGMFLLFVAQAEHDRSLEVVFNSHLAEQ